MFKIIGESGNILRDKIISQLAVEIEKKIPNIEGEIYVGYPIFIDSITKNSVTIDAMFITCNGVFALNILEEMNMDYGAIQDDIYTKLESRLKRYSFLVNKRNLAFELNVVTFCDKIQESISDDYPVINNWQEISIIQKILSCNYDKELYNKIISGIQEAYGIKNRTIVDDISKVKAIKIKQMNDIVERYDADQMDAILKLPDGIQRIRGMAGSGKTIVLAKKATELHIKYPNWNIVVTFSTRSLNNQIQNIIDKFYKSKTDGESPNWEKIKVMNSWGSRNNKGVYYEICSKNGIEPLTYTQAQTLYGNANTFEKMCGDVIEKLKEKEIIHPLYDCIIVDEAQDLNSNFYKMCLLVLTPEKRLVYAYDELQNLSNSTMPSPTEIFGMDIQADTPLRVCYRNQLETIVTAHAIGTGIYRKEGIIQFPGSKDVWEAIGYKSEHEIIPGQPITLYRTTETSPNLLNESPEEIIKLYNCSDSVQQNAKIIEMIKEAINDGVPQEEIMIIDMDTIAHVENRGNLYLYIKENVIENINIHIAGEQTKEDFFRPNSIVYSSIYRAKGNEAYYVIIVNAHKSINSLTSTKDRNSLFTAITRSKGWTRILGYGKGMEELIEEYEKIKENEFKLVLEHYPTEEELKNITKNNADIDRNKQRNLDNVRKVIRDLKKNGKDEDVLKIAREIFELDSDEETEMFIAKLKREDSNE